jgi:undecaprenyl-diphosphatase
MFDIALHLGTLLAVTIYFRNDVLALLDGVRHWLLGRKHTREAQMLWMMVLVTTPAVISGFLMKDFVEFGARSLILLGCTQLFYGALLGFADRRPVRVGVEGVGLTWKRALFLGMFQALSVVPGTSRSGSVFTAARLMGYSRQYAGRIASLSAIPITFLVVCYGLLKVAQDPAAHVIAGSWQDFVTGITVSFLTALLALHILMGFVVRVGAWPFAAYRVILGIGLLLLGFGVI